MTIEDRPNSFPLPPVLLALFIIGGLAIKHFAPGLALPFPETVPVVFIGWVLILAALALDAWAIVEFRRHKTNVMPTNPALALVDTGPFAHSRNPIYLGNVMLIAGIGLVNSTGLMLVFAVLNAVLLQTIQIRGEEAHLAARFGQAWDSYRTRVRRWL